MTLNESLEFFEASTFSIVGILRDEFKKEFSSKYKYDPRKEQITWTICLLGSFWRKKEIFSAVIDTKNEDLITNIIIYDETYAKPLILFAKEVLLSQVRGATFLKSYISSTVHIKGSSSRKAEKLSIRLK